MYIHASYLRFAMISVHQCVRCSSPRWVGMPLGKQILRPFKRLLRLGITVIHVGFGVLQPSQLSGSPSTPAS